MHDNRIGGTLTTMNLNLSQQLERAEPVVEYVGSIRLATTDDGVSTLMAAAGDRSAVGQRRAAGARRGARDQRFLVRCRGPN